MLWQVFNTNLQRMRQIGVALLYVLEVSYKQVTVGSMDLFGLWRIIGKNCENFLSNFFVTYLGCVMTKINKSQKISTCYVKYVLFIIEKTKQKGSIDQGWQYVTVRSKFVYYGPRPLNRTVPAYRTSFQFLNHTVSMYCTRTTTKKAYCTSVPYFLAKIDA